MTVKDANIADAPSQPVPPTPAPDWQDWALLIALVVAGGSSFSGIRVAVESAPPTVIAAGRLWIAALVLFIYMKATGRRLPVLRTPAGRLAPVTWYALAIAVTGYSAPMLLFPFAQQTVSSMLAGIYMACMPLMTVVLAAAFADEPLTPRKIIGFLAGTLGVFLIIGPDAFKNLLSDSVLAQGALLLAATGYAVASVIMRRAPTENIQARSFGFLLLFFSAIFVTPLAVWDARFVLQDITPVSWLAIVYLGIVPTGITSIFIIHLIRGPGAGFMAMGNYLTPVMAIILGAALFGEALFARYAVGLGVILIGVAIAQGGPASRLANWMRARTSDPR